MQEIKKVGHNKKVGKKEEIRKSRKSENVGNQNKSKI